MGQRAAIQFSARLLLPVAAGGAAELLLQDCPVDQAVAAQDYLTQPAARAVQEIRQVHLPCKVTAAATQAVRLRTTAAAAAAVLVALGLMVRAQVVAAAA
jgi:hypothetical protein